MSREHGAMPWETLAGSSTRAPRTLETQERTRQSEAYRPPSLLPDPDPRDGYAFRWVRVETRNNADKMNLNRRRREGYEPVHASDHPELMAEILGADDANGIVSVGGLVLHRIAIEKVQARERYYAEHNARQVDAADSQFLSHNDHRLAKVVDRRSTFGRSLT